MPSEIYPPQDNSESKKYNIPGYENIEDFIKDGYKTLMEAIKQSNNLPQDSNYKFYQTHEGFVKIIKEESEKVLKQISTILRTNQIQGSISNRGIDEKTELIVEANDNILERVANNIDEINGIRKTGNAPILIQSISTELPINGSWNRIENNATFSVTSSLASKDKSSNNGHTIRLLTAKNIIRPQNFFKDKIINSSKLPWEPRIKEKPNSLKPLAIFLEETENGEEYSHPYELELERFKPPPEQLQKEIPVTPLPIEATPLIEVSEPDQIDELLNTLRNCKEFAVDLEHHSYRSFMGITCLMQISTREKDYLVDTLALRDKLYILNEVFTKPTILKIFHGADSDILWLQRDLSIYVVNMFDTYQAAKQLEYSGLSLAYLMERFCRFVPNKKFQLADWRIRPLPKELKQYAREDTHYLLYIYQKLRNELLDKANGFDNLLLSVFNKSTDVCKKRYFRSVLKDDSHMDFYRKCKRLFDNRQLYALKELFRWRDQLSREEDESTGYVLPNHMLLQISETLPREMQGILACCNPIPPLVRSNLLELHQIILRAREQPLEKPIFQEDTRARGATKKISKINIDSSLNCPHDLTKSSEYRDDLPTVLGNKVQLSTSTLAVSKLEIETNSPKCSVFDTPENSADELIPNIKEKMQSFNYLGPFERYKLARPYIQAEEEKLAEQNKLDTQKVNENSGEPTQTESSADAEEKTDEERIESIRNLYLSLSKKPPPNFQSDQTDLSLIQMGGTKRKRESSLNAETSAAPHPLFIPISNENLHEDNYRKRRSNEPPHGIPPAKKKNKKQKKNFNQRGNDQEGFWTPRNQNSGEQRGQQNQRGKKMKFKSTRNQNNQKDQASETSQHHHDQQDECEQGGSERHQPGQSKKARYNQRKRPDKNNQNQRRFDNQKRHNQGNQHNQYNQQGTSYGENTSQQCKEEPDSTSFDYSSVDFRQFSGGAGSVSKPREFKNAYKRKNKNKNGNKGNNKSSIIGVSPQGNGGRGGGKGGGRGGGKGGGRGGGRGGGKGRGRGR